MNKKFIILGILLTVLTTKSYSQTGFNTESKDSTNIYYYSLIKYCDYLDQLQEKPNIIFVEKNYLFAQSLPCSIRSYEIEYLDEVDIRTHLKHRKELTLVRIVPLRVNGSDFFVNVIPFKVSYKKKNFNYINGGGLGVKFEYDKKINGLKYKSSEMGGM